MGLGPVGDAMRHVRTGRPRWVAGQRLGVPSLLRQRACVSRTSPVLSAGPGATLSSAALGRQGVLPLGSVLGVPHLDASSPLGEGSVRAKAATRHEAGLAARLPLKITAPPFPSLIQAIAEPLRGPGRQLSASIPSPDPDQAQRRSPRHSSDRG